MTMKILWITNNPFPDVFEELNIQGSVNEGWIHSSATSLLSITENLVLSVVSFYKGNVIKRIAKNGIVHFLIPRNGVHSDHIDEFKLIYDLVLPDVVHFQGTEYPHVLSFLKICNSEKVVISIQGLVSVIEKFYFGGISQIKLLSKITLRDIIRIDTLFSQKRNMRQRGIMERSVILQAKNVIGRTNWDRSHIWAINPSINYFSCNETLRPSFYKNQWSLDKCERHTIFLSQAHYPLKGLHKLIEALPLILRLYPDTVVYVAGNNFFTNRGIRLHGFGNFINSIIRKNNLTENIVFTGVLSEEKMCNQFLKSHVFISPSAIENSPNSVGEAQLLGTPCVASYVGGTSDMVIDGQTGLLYRYEETGMLAYQICRIFADDNLANTLSENGKMEASVRHNPSINAIQLLNIYKQIAEGEISISKIV